jgi:proprotein convertase subtilisin/kexin type 5
MKSCVINCDDGYFNDNRIPLNPKCTFCNDNCLTCKNSAIYCTSCKENFQLISSVCYECPDGTYLSGTTCKPCKTNC